jgi:hypothetical protein
MSHKVFPSVVAVYEAGCIKGELVFACVYRFVTCLSYIIVQPIIPYRVTSLSEVTVQAYVTYTVDYTEQGCLMQVLRTVKALLLTEYFSDPKSLQWK